MTTSILASDVLSPNGKLNASAIAQAAPDEATLTQALAAATTNAHKAALVLVGALRGFPALASTFDALLDDDALAGRAAVWALANLGGEATVARALSAIEKGGVVRRENAYQTLCAFIARSGVPAGLADTMVERVRAENDRARSGRTGLGAEALRVLACAGDGRVEELAREVIDADRFASRVELDRLRKAMKDDGRDVRTLTQFRGAWTNAFQDALMPEAEPDEAPSPRKPSSAHEPPPSKAPASPPASQAPGASPAQAPAAGPVDWADFLKSPEATSLSSRAAPMAKQLGQLLEQLAERGVGVPLGELTGEEIVALLLQVLPQSLPPQSVQMALSPEALHVYEAVLRYLVRTGGAVNGAELIEAIRLVRRQLREQVRQSGLLDGPDYSDPATDGEA